MQAEFKTPVSDGPPPADTGSANYFYGAPLRAGDVEVTVHSRPRRVRFDQHDLWPDYDGSERDRLILEIYQHWLRPAKEETT